MRKTARDRFRRALKRIHQWCRRARHWPITDQHAGLVLKVRGHDAYYGSTGNMRALERCHTAVERLWKRWLGKRSWHSPTELAVVSRVPGAPSATPCPRRPLRAPLTSRSSGLTSRMRETCTSGSVGAPGEQFPGATRRIQGVADLQAVPPRMALVRSQVGALGQETARQPRPRFADSSHQGSLSGCRASHRQARSPLHWAGQALLSDRAHVKLAAPASPPACALRERSLILEA